MQLVFLFCLLCYFPLLHLLSVRFIVNVLLLRPLLLLIMYQSIPAVNIPLGDPCGFAHPFCPAPRGITCKFVPREPGFRRGQIFPEMNENLLNIFIFRGCLQEAIQNGRKNSRFCLHKLHLSPRISLLIQLKE